MIMISMDKRPIEQLKYDLEKFSERALPYAVRDTLNTAAYKTSNLARRNAKRVFQMRNNYTVRSIQFKKTFSKNVDRMESAAGSLQEYMREQEEGFTRHKKGKHGVPIPTSASAGQAGAKPRTKPVRRINWMSRLQMSTRLRRQYKSTKQSLVRRVQEAIESGGRVTFLGIREQKNSRYKKGFYRVLGGRKVKRGWPAGARLQLLYEVERSSVQARARQWLGPPSRFIGAKMDEFYKAALIRQIERQRAFRNKK